jgi:hypothetical protein
MREKLFGLILLFSTMAVLAGCATMSRTTHSQVVAASGATAVQVRVFANGALIYDGNLPATFAVRSGATYTVAYTATDGEIRTVTIARRFNGWFIGSLLLGLFPAIVDLATQSVMIVEPQTVLPISYSPMIVLSDFIPEHPELKTVGFFDYD